VLAHYDWTMTSLRLNSTGAVSTCYDDVVRVGRVTRMLRRIEDVTRKLPTCRLCRACRQHVTSKLLPWNLAFIRPAHGQLADETARTVRRQMQTVAHKFPRRERRQTRAVDVHVVGTGSRAVRRPQT